MSRKPIPITVFTGYLGSGKTTIILNLVKEMPQDYKMAWLKNEFGDTKIDSEMAKEKNIGTKEMINGCLCCVLVGKLGNALKEIAKNYNPKRIIIETSGSAYPAPIAWEIRRLSDQFKLDAIITVIDAINFDGYKDKSYTAKMQTEYTDIILINKHEKVGEEKLDDVLDDVYEMNLITPKIKTDKGKIDPDLIFGIDTDLFSKKDDVKILAREKKEYHQESEVDLLEVRTDKSFNKDKLSELLKDLSKEYFYRIKGVVKIGDKFELLNCVFGRFDFTPLKKYQGISKFVFMGLDLACFKDKIISGLEVKEEEVKITQRKDH
ncbi:MAG: GTP-binding protein [bacterium]